MDSRGVASLIFYQPPLEAHWNLFENTRTDETTRYNGCEVPFNNEIDPDIHRIRFMETASSTREDFPRGAREITRSDPPDIQLAISITNVKGVSRIIFNFS